MKIGDRFRTAWQGLICALQFLTRLPVRQGPWGDTSVPKHLTLAEAAWAFPVAGLVVGLTTGGVYFLALTVGFGALPAAILSVASGVAFTGALHEDGLADFFDGMGARKKTTSARLAIMRDSKIGVFGVLALLFSVALRIGALAQMAGPETVASFLIAAHLLSRGLLPWAMRLLPALRKDGLSVGAGTPTGVGATAAIFIGGATSLAVLDVSATAIILAAAALSAFAVGVWAKRRLGGQTGDVLGAIQQGAEIAILLAGAALSGGL